LGVESRCCSAGDHHEECDHVRFVQRRSVAPELARFERISFGALFSDEACLHSSVIWHVHGVDSKCVLECGG
jgi:hypothetical protein